MLANCICRCSEISWSMKGSSRLRESTRVTFTPRAEKIEAYSEPITPPPMTAMVLGMNFMFRIESESWINS